MLLSDCDQLILRLLKRMFIVLLLAQTWDKPMLRNLGGKRGLAKYWPS